MYVKNIFFKTSIINFFSNFSVFVSFPLKRAMLSVNIASYEVGRYVPVTTYDVLIELFELAEHVLPIWVCVVVGSNRLQQAQRQVLYRSTPGDVVFHLHFLEVNSL